MFLSQNFQKAVHFRPALPRETGQLCERVKSDRRPIKNCRSFPPPKPQRKQRVPLRTCSLRLLHQPLSRAARLVSSQVGGTLMSISISRAVRQQQQWATPQGVISPSCACFPLPSHFRAFSTSWLENMDTFFHRKYLSKPSEHNVL